MTRGKRGRGKHIRDGPWLGREEEEELWKMYFGRKRGGKKYMVEESGLERNGKKYRRWTLMGREEIFF
jgi:hypothetical protein